MRLPTRLVICAALMYVQAAAQKDKYEPVKEDWAISKSTYSINPGMTDYFSPSYDKSIIYTGSDKAVLLTNIKNDYSLVCINTNGETLWQLAIPGKGLGISKRKDNYLVMYQDKDNNARVLLVDGKTHQAAADKNIYSPGKADCNYFIESSPSGEFDHLLIRTGSTKRSDYLATSKLELVYIDEALAPKLFDITRDIGDGYFGGNVTGDNGTHFIVYLNVQGAVIKKYNTQGKVVGSLTAHFYFAKISRALCSLDAENHEAVCLCIKYKTEDKKDADVTAYADFTAKKAVTSAEQVFDKDYQKAVKMQIIKNPDIVSYSLRALDDLVPAQIITTGDKILVIKEIRYDKREGNTDHYYNLHIFISTYTKSMKLVSEMVLERSNEMFLPYCRTLGVHVKNNMLYLITSSLVGVSREGTVFDAIDLTTNTVVTTGILFKQKFLESGAAEGAATLWFDNSNLVNIMHVANKLTRINLSSSLQRVDY